MRHISALLSNSKKMYILSKEIVSGWFGFRASIWHNAMSEGKVTYKQYWNISSNILQKNL